MDYILFSIQEKDNNKEYTFIDTDNMCIHINADNHDTFTYLMYGTFEKADIFLYKDKIYNLNELIYYLKV